MLDGKNKTKKNEYRFGKTRYIEHNKETMSMYEEYTIKLFLKLILRAPYKANYVSSVISD